MASITVHLLNFHGPVTHIEILLENTSVRPHLFYSINRWNSPSERFHEQRGRDERDLASTIYSFNIEAEPKEIIQRWGEFHQRTLGDAGIVSHNCAISAQWFLREFANIPDPHPFSAPISINHVAMGLFLPSFIPMGVTLPGRIMSNAQFHIEARNHPELFTQYSDCLLSVYAAVCALAMASCVVGIILASVYLTGGLALVTVATDVVVGAASSYGFFNTMNIMAAKEISRTAQIDRSDARPSTSFDESIKMA